MQKYFNNSRKHNKKPERYSKVSMEKIFELEDCKCELLCIARLNFPVFIITVY